MEKLKQNIQRLRRRVYKLVRDDGSKNTAHTVFESVIIALIVISTVQIVLDTFNMPPAIAKISQSIEIVCIALFTLEYLMRLWTAPLRYPHMKPWRAMLKYAFSFMAVIDLLAIVPFYIRFIFHVDLRVLRTLRLLRMFSLFKVNRYTHALTAIVKVIKRKSSHLMSSIFVLGILMLISSVIMYNAENAAQPDKFANVIDALWWAVSTVTTVGYGDIYPITAAGRFFSSIISLLGIGIVAIPTGILSAGFMEQEDKEVIKDEIENVDKKEEEAIKDEIKDVNKKVEKKEEEKLEKAVQLEIKPEAHAAAKSPEKAAKAGSADDEKRFCPYCGHALD